MYDRDDKRRLSVVSNETMNNTHFVAPGYTARKDLLCSQSNTSTAEYDSQLGSRRSRHTFQDTGLYIFGRCKPDDSDIRCCRCIPVYRTVELQCTQANKNKTDCHRTPCTVNTVHTA